MLQPRNFDDTANVSAFFRGVPRTYCIPAPFRSLAYAGRYKVLFPLFIIDQFSLAQLFSLTH